MQPQPKLPRSDEADPEVQSTPAGMTEELEDEIDEHDAAVGPAAAEEATSFPKP